MYGCVGSLHYIRPVSIYPDGKIAIGVVHSLDSVFPILKNEKKTHTNTHTDNCVYHSNSGVRFIFCPFSCFCTHSKYCSLVTQWALKLLHENGIEREREKRNAHLNFKVPTYFVFCFSFKSRPRHSSMYECE